MTMSVSRRGFLRSIPSLFALPVAASASTVSQLSSASAAEIISAAPPVTEWAVGTPGDVSWRPVSAASPQEAFAQFCDGEGVDPSERPMFSEDFVRRMSETDGMAPEIISKPGLIDECTGGRCERCDGEVSGDTCHLISGDVVCTECLTYAESLSEYPERGFEELVNLVVNEGEHDALDFIVQHDDFELIGEETWARVVAEAALRQP